MTLIRRLIEEWAEAVRKRDMEAILRHHHPDIVMFDVPPPFESEGLSAYRESWTLFFSTSPEPAVFDVQRLEVVAGSDVAFAVALMRCKVLEGAEFSDFDFRLTVGFRKIAGQWTFVHEHHSVPAND